MASKKKIGFGILILILSYKKFYEKHAQVPKSIIYLETMMKFFQIIVVFHLQTLKFEKNRIHTTANNKRLLLMHGHEFDGIVLNSKWVAKIGAVLYDYSVWFNNILNFCRRKLGLSYWSLSGYLKNTSKRCSTIY